MTHFDVITIFPEIIQEYCNHGVLRMGLRDSLLRVGLWNPRDYTSNKHRNVDDRPYGGGPGMVMMAEPLDRAITMAKMSQADAGVQSHTIYLSPQGEKLTHKVVKKLSEIPGLILVCGRYEGIDERIIDLQIDQELSIGDYVLSGGELPALVLIDTIIRQLPGVLGNHDSANQESFASGLLDHPQYTRPSVYRNRSVPKVLISGDDRKIQDWRSQQSIGRSWTRRPDLFPSPLSTAQSESLNQYLKSINSEEP